MAKEDLKTTLENKKQRLELYYSREKEMLEGGVQSYGLGTRSATRYNTDLAQIRAAIKELETEIAELKGALVGKRPRRTVGIIPRDY